jgi:uncharacterized membrane protein YhaH (DUF805 family)
MQDWLQAGDTELAVEFSGPPPLPSTLPELPKTDYAPNRSAQNTSSERSQQVGLSPEESMWAHFKACVGRNYSNGDGRATRKEYWSFIFFWWIGFIILSFAVGVLSAVTYTDYGASPAVVAVAFILAGLGFLWLVIPSIALSSRRLHDVGLSGWLYLLAMVPYLGAFFLFVVALIPSEKRANQYGPDPFAGLRPR